MDFVTKSFRKDETLTSWTLLQHICPHFWAWLLLYSAITPKIEDKYVEKVFNWSEFHLSKMTLLQNPYFRGTSILWRYLYFIHTTFNWKLQCSSINFIRSFGISLQIESTSNNLNSSKARILHTWLSQVF